MRMVQTDMPWKMIHKSRLEAETVNAETLVQKTPIETLHRVYIGPVHNPEE